MASEQSIAAEEHALRDGAIAVAEAKASIDRHIRNVNSSMTELGSAWTGAAAAAFQQMMERWQQQATKLNRVLDDLEANLKSTEAKQAASEEEHQHVISNIAGMMG